MPFIVKTLVDHGSSNPVVARLSFQANQLLRHTTADDTLRSELTKILNFELLPRLLRCWEIKASFESELGKARASFTSPSAPGRAVQLPQIPKLEPDCRNFLYEAKASLRDVLRLLNALYGTSFDEPSEFSKGKKKQPSVIEWASKHFGEDERITLFLGSAVTDIMRLVRARNAVEHPGGHSGNLAIRNIDLDRAGTLRPPTVYREKDGKIEDPLAPISVFYEVSIENLLSLAEGVIVSWAEKNIEAPSFFTIRHIPEPDRDPDCPVAWVIEPRPELSGGE